MNNSTKIQILIYGLALILATAGESLLIRSTALPKLPPVFVCSPQGMILAQTLSYRWARDFKMMRLPRLPGMPVYATVLIDPGHGGKDPGARGPANAVEKNIVLDVGLRLQSILGRHGIHALMTRTDDIFFSLRQRVEMAERYHVDVLLSLHVNASSYDDVSGIEIFFASEEMYWPGVHEALTDAVMNVGEALSGAPEPLRQYSDSKKRLREQSQALAQNVSRELSAAVGARNRGVKREHFYVLTEAAVPAILIEMGFVTNGEEGRKLNTEEYRQALAAALAQILLDYEPQQ